MSNCINALHTTIRVILQAGENPGLGGSNMFTQSSLVSYPHRRFPPGGRASAIYYSGPGSHRKNPVHELQVRNGKKMFGYCNGK